MSRIRSLSIQSLGLAALLAAAGGCRDEPRGAAGSGEARPASDTSPGAAQAARASRRPLERPPIEPPMDVSAPPAEARKIDSGMAFVVLSEGTRDETPGINDIVQIHYTTWTTGGETRFSTRHRNRAHKRYLPRQPAGWVELLTAMKVGEKRLVWMPPGVSPTGRGHEPAQTMVYEIELVDIERAPATPENLSAPPDDARTTGSGIAYQVLAPGVGNASPRAWDLVTMHYSAWGPDGKLLESTHTKERPDQVNLLRAAPGWVEVLETMVIGQKVRAWIPASQVASRPFELPADALAVYEIELVELEKRTDPPPVPGNVAAPPGNARKSKSGIAHQVLKPGAGKQRPQPSDTVRVHYTFWTTDGTMHDSTRVEGTPVSLLLERTAPGFAEALQAMVEGESRRLWIPAELAETGRPGEPEGMRVYDVELVEIVAPPPAPDMPAGHPGPGHGSGGRQARPQGEK